MTLLRSGRRGRRRWWFRARWRRFSKAGIRLSSEVVLDSDGIGGADESESEQNYHLVEVFAIMYELFGCLSFFSLSFRAGVVFRFPGLFSCSLSVGGGFPCFVLFFLCWSSC